jgi:hypothetical protein
MTPEELLRQLTPDWIASAETDLLEQIYRNRSVLPKGVFATYDRLHERAVIIRREIASRQPDKGQQIFHTHIAGNVGNVAAGSHSFIQSATVQIAKGDFSALENAVRSLGGGDAEIRELKDAVSLEPKPKPGQLGTRVSDWLGKMISKSAQGALSVGTSVAAKFLTEALKQYYGS